MLTNDSLTISRIFLINNFEKLPNGLTIKLGNQACSSMRKISFRYVASEPLLSCRLPLSKNVIVRNHWYENVPNTG